MLPKRHNNHAGKFIATVSRVSQEKDWNSDKGSKIIFHERNTDIRIRIAIIFAISCALLRFIFYPVGITFELSGCALLKGRLAQSAEVKC